MATATENQTDLSGETLTLGEPVNVKVKGEKAMRKGVTLKRDPNDPERVRVLTGKRGRPATLAVADIERHRAL